MLPLKKPIGVASSPGAIRYKAAIPGLARGARSILAPPGTGDPPTVEHSEEPEFLSVPSVAKPLPA
jgi:hypothetical protein